MSEFPKELVNEIKAYLKDMIPQVSINCVIFRYYEGALQVGVVNFQFMDESAIPGGFIHKNENIIDAARRVVKDQTGLKDFLLREVGVFGNSDRKFEGFYKHLKDRAWPTQLLTGFQCDFCRQYTIVWYRI